MRKGKIKVFHIAASRREFMHVPNLSCIFGSFLFFSDDEEPRTIIRAAHEFVIGELSFRHRASKSFGSVESKREI